MALSQLNDEPKNFSERALAWPARTRSYIQEIQAEMRLVSWPNWKQVRATTVVVILSVFAFAAYFFVVDLFMVKTINRMFDAFTH